MISAGGMSQLFFEFDAACSVDRRYANRYRDAFSAGAVPKRPELRRAVRWTNLSFCGL